MNHPKRLSVFVAVGLVLLCLTMVTVSALSPVGAPKVMNEAIVTQDVQTGDVVTKDQNGNCYLMKKLAGNIISKSEIVAGQIIIKYKQNQFSIQSSEAISKVTGKFSAQMKSIDDTLRLKLIKIPNEANYLKIIEELKLCPEIEYAEPDYVVRALLTPNDPYYGNQWGPPYVKANEAWDKVSVSQRSTVTIAIVDTGIALSHPDLGANIVRGYDYVNNDSDPNDDNNHGTHCAGIAAAIVNNGVGVAGIAGGAKLMPVKVLNSGGSGSTSAIVQGMRYAADNGAKVLSMSLGGAGTSSAFQDAVNYVMSKGAVVVAASGNENGPVSTPGNCNGVITVGSIDRTGSRSSFSNYGSSLDIVAPGSSIYSCLRSGYGNMSGTSMATPCVAGIAALIFAVKSNATPADVTRIIQQCATDAGTAGFDNYYGYGIVNASKAVDLALGGQTSTPTPTPTRGVTPTPTSRRNSTGTPTPTRVNTPTPTRSAVTGNYVVAYVISSDWGTGATINVTITNNTTTAVNGWTLAFTFPGNQTITNLWNGAYTQSGASVSVKDAGFNASIGANGGSTNFGFNLNYSGANTRPASFTLNGVACSVQ
jgi:thermitase